MGAKPHICFLAPTTWPILTRDPSVGLAGGAELQQTLIATTLAKRGYRVSMVSIDWGQKDGAEAQGVRVYNLHKPEEGIPVLRFFVGSSRVDLQACKLEYSIVSPK